MLIKIVVIMFLVFITNTALCSEELSTITIPIDDETVRINYVDKYSKVINQDITNESGIKTIRLLETKLKADSNEKYIIDFCEGASWDPGFIIYHLVDKKLLKITYTSSLEITIPSNGYFYTSGHSNNMFNARRKFTIENDKLKEVDQPFYYVGLSSKIKKDAAIFSDMDMKTVVEQIRKDTLVTVLLNYNDYYLIKTEYGLIGWIKIPFGLSKDESIIDGIFYAGD